MRKIIIFLIVLLVILIGATIYFSQIYHNEYLEKIDKKAHQICEKAGMEYLSHVPGFFSQWKASCFNKESQIIGEVTFK